MNDESGTNFGRESNGRSLQQRHTQDRSRDGLDSGVGAAGGGRLEPISSANVEPRWVLVGRLGAGRSIPHPESTIQGRAYEAYEWGASSLQASGAIGHLATGVMSRFGRERGY